MSEIQKTRHVLPPEIAENFKTIGPDSLERDGYIRDLRAAGWTLQSIAAASGVTRERVRQIVAEGTPEGFRHKASYTIPPVPTKPEKAKPVYVEPSPETLARLLELQENARKVRGNGKNFRAEAEEYTRLLNHAHTVEGVTLYRLAKRLGVTHGALRYRLVRYGYKQPVSGQSKVYTPVKRENRAI